MPEWVLIWGIPSAIVGGIVSLALYLFKRKIDKKDREREDREQKRAEEQRTMLYMLLEGTNANSVAIKATCEAIQRIPDAHCNGDMHAAIAYLETVDNKRKDFLREFTAKHIID